MQAHTEDVKTHGSGNIGASDTFYRCIEVVECLALNDLGADLTANAERREAALNSQQPVLRVSYTHRM